MVKTYEFYIKLINGFGRGRFAFLYAVYLKEKVTKKGKAKTEINKSNKRKTYLLSNFLINNLFKPFYYHD